MVYKVTSVYTHRNDYNILQIENKELYKETINLTSRKDDQR